ncbi:LysR family transcriptional regulator [Aestuariicoccus sp. MJ-SS9]|uniref:LysR family transcriptional regulator n=1 Tax=Aestuariicoccus sp. MJ-SS9 TaxID=3079855 RepID=UPI0029075E53|nr:LysR family transcriptional regulator [Aestuariicoccus sp. MJ-SS9]MDU8911356.1 LysR family transcriptional regulator [Aestuariicoccus sp. MJ-SS9]
MTFDWDHAKTFLAVAEAGSLSGAARALGQTQPTVSRQIAAFETALDATLFERTGRSVALTPFGVELLDHVRAMARGADMVALSATGQSQSVEGQVRITASELMSAFVLPPILMDISQQAPSLEIDVVADNGVRDLTRREADIAIRHARPEQPNLQARRLSDERMRFYASATYLETAGQPAKCNLSKHQIVSYVEADRMLNYLLPAGLDLTRGNFRFTSSSQFVALEMARGGLGLVILPERVAARLPDLVPVARDIGVFDLPTWLVTHSEVKTSRRIRLVFDVLADSLS